MGKSISAIMQRVISPVRMDDTIGAVEDVMKTNRISSTPVYDENGAVIGIITTTDLLRHHTGGRENSAVKAWELCSYRPLQVSPDTPAATVAELMVQHQVHHVLVMQGASAEGIVSALDFVRLYLDECRD